MMKHGSLVETSRNKRYDRGSWHRYERSDRTLRSGLLALLLGARSSLLVTGYASWRRRSYIIIASCFRSPPKSDLRATPLANGSRLGRMDQHPHKRILAVFTMQKQKTHKYETDIRHRNRNFFKLLHVPVLSSNPTFN